MDKLLKAGGGQKRRGVFVSALIVLYIFSASKFYFFNIVGIRKELVFLLVLLSMLLVVGNLGKFSKLFVKWDPFLIFLYISLIYWYFNGNTEYVFLLLSSTIYSAWILIMPERRLINVIKLFVVVSCVFSLLVIIQSAIFILNQSLFFSTVYNPLGGLTGSMDELSIDSPLHYLGFWASGSVRVFGVQLMRFQSFASEPSILVSLFVVPGLLGLITGYKKLLSYIILLFAIILSSAGTVYLAVAFGVFVLIVDMTVKKLFSGRKENFRLIILVVFSAVFLLSTIVFNAYETTSILDSGFNKYDKYSSILGYAGNKAEHRVTSTQQAYQLLINNPLGIKSTSEISVVGMLLDFGLRLGWGGVILCLLIYTPILKRLVKVLANSKYNSIGVALLIGTILQSLVFSSYGFTNPGGFVVSSIVIAYSRKLN